MQLAWGERGGGNRNSRGFLIFSARTEQAAYSETCRVSMGQRTDKVRRFVITRHYLSGVCVALVAIAGRRCAYRTVYRVHTVGLF